MPATFTPKKITTKAVSAMTAIAVGVTINASAPTRADADAKDFIAGAIIGGLIAGSVKNNKKKSNKSGKKRTVAKKKAGPADAMALNRDQQRLIQEGLAAQGFYSGAIDGVIGRGTRASIRDWQRFSGFGVTGVLTGAQINMLIAASPVYASLAADDARWYGAEIARDLDRDGIRRLQAALNALGYNAGPVDGSWGRKTREALAAYKAREGLLGGPVPTKRVLARLDGVPYAPGPVLVAGAAVAPVVAGAAAVVTPAAVPKVADGQGIARLDEPSPGALAIVEADDAAAVAPASAIHFEVAGMRLGMSEDEFVEVTDEDFEEEFAVFTGAGGLFGGNDVLSYGQVLTDVAWPADGSQQIVSVYDDTVPEYGAIALFRTVILPAAVTQDIFEANVVPGLIEAYGTEGMVGETLVWIGEGTARKAARVNASAVAACGTLALAEIDRKVPGPEQSWGANKGPLLDTESLSSVSSDCGDVLTVKFSPGALSFALWNSNYINAKAAADGGGIVPEIKF
ncbi:MAG: peptidoglycan-binding domain-containing protein [Pseudomonadota bacterium]